VALLSSVFLLFVAAHFSRVYEITLQFAMRFSNRDALARLSHGIWSSALNRNWERVAVGQPPGLLISCIEFPERWSTESVIVPKEKNKSWRR
jgi:predicted GH43/DUF377 family glycosyl hydrolase